MSNISTIIDKIRQVVPTISGFSGKAELYNPYSVEDNNINDLKDGWGLAVLDSSLSDLGEFCFHQESRQFKILLTKRTIRLETDVVALHTDSKALLEDAKNLAVRFVNPDQLGIDSNINKIDFIGNSGIEFFKVGKFNYLVTETIFGIDITENI